MKSGKKNPIVHVLFVFLCAAVLVGTFGVSYVFAEKFAGDVLPNEGSTQTQSQPKDTENDETTDLALDDRFFIERAVFVGDSRIHGFSSYGYIPQERVFALDGSNQKTILENEFVDIYGDESYFCSLIEALDMTQPQYILIGLGINGLPSFNEEEFIEEYQNLVDSITAVTPDSKIVIMSIMPVSQRKELAVPMMSNDRIDEFNGYLEEFCIKNNFEFLDISDALKNENNALAYEYDAGDGLHFSNGAYRTLIEEINRVIG